MENASRQWMWYWRPIVAIRQGNIRFLSCTSSTGWNCRIRRRWPCIVGASICWKGIGTAILDFSFRNIVEHSLHEEARVALLGPAQRVASLHILRRDLLTASLLSLVVATLISAWVAHRISVRLRRIVDFSSRIAAGDFTARIEEHDSDEIGEVARALDATAGRLGAHDPRRDYASVVEDQQVIGAQQTRKVPHRAVLRARLRVQNQQTARGALGEGCLRDQLGRQVKGKVR